MKKSISKFGAKSASSNVIKFKILNNTTVDLYVTIFNYIYTSKPLLQKNKQICTINKSKDNPCVLVVSQANFDNSLYTDKTKWPYVYKDPKYIDNLNNVYYCWTFDTLNEDLSISFLNNLIIYEPKYKFNTISPFTNISRFGESVKNKFNKILIVLVLLIVGYLIYKKYFKK